MPASREELLAARIFLRAVFPVMKVVLDELPGLGKSFSRTTAKIQFIAKNDPDPVGAYLVFEQGALSIAQGICEHPEITFGFSSVKKMNAMLAGKPVLPSIKGIKHVGLLINTLRLLLALKLLMPNARPKNKAKRRLKVKMTLYMITTALSQYNKGDDPEMKKWTSKQPERIYQMSVEDEDIAAYVRVKKGLSKAGRGTYQRRKPFVHMRLNGVEGAMKVLTKEVEFVEGVGKGYVTVEGSPEYAAQMNDFMMRIQGLVMG